MPQIPYKDTRTIALTVPNPAAKIQVVVPNSQHYLGFTIQVIAAKCDVGAGDQGFNIEISLDGVNWALLYSADFYTDADPHVHEGQAITFSLRAPALGKVRISSRANMSTPGSAIISMYDRAFPPQV